MKQGLTLTEIAYWSRETIKYGIAFIIFLLVARFVWLTGYRIYRHYYPEPPTPPTVTFGKLPTLSFSTAQQPTQETQLQFNLELPEGNLPKTSTVLPVYVVQSKRASLGALDQSKTLAQRLGFNKGGESTSSTLYHFHQEQIDSILEMNIVTGTFSISSSLYQDPTLLSLHPPTQDEAVTAVKSFLSRGNIYPDDFTQGKTTFIFARYDNGKLVPAVSLSEAQFIRIDLFRQNYKDLPVVTPFQNRSNVWFVLSGANDAKQIIGGEYHYYKVDPTNSATYPLKSAQQAWEELKSSKGVFINLPAGNNSITVRRVYLAYYDSSDYQEFFQPVFVFEGDNGFLGYVPAVIDAYYGK